MGCPHRITPFTVHVAVIQKNIDAGTRGTTARCPIALALRAAGFTGVSVKLSVIRAQASVSGEAHQYEARVPPAVREFIGAFDNGAPVVPLDFDLHFKKRRSSND